VSAPLARPSLDEANLCLCGTGCRWIRITLDELLQRFSSWTADWDRAKQARLPTVRGWERLPVFVL
jgi:hypothetical protein